MSDEQTLPTRAATLLVSDLKQERYENNQFVVVLPEGMGMPEVLKPGFWKNCCLKMKLLDTIKVVPNDGTWMAELMVRSVSRTEAVMGVINYVDFSKQVIPGAVSVSASEDLQVIYTGLKRKWAIFKMRESQDVNGQPVKKKDGEPLKDSFDTKEQAQAYLNDQLKSRAA